MLPFEETTPFKHHLTAKQFHTSLMPFAKESQAELHMLNCSFGKWFHHSWVLEILQNRNSILVSLF
eukprot:c4929_g1_i1 orf=23-220(+)